MAEPLNVTPLKGATHPERGEPGETGWEKQEQNTIDFWPIITFIKAAQLKDEDTFPIACLPV